MGRKLRDGETAAMRVAEDEEKKKTKYVSLLRFFRLTRKTNYR